MRAQSFAATATRRSFPLPKNNLHLQPQKQLAYGQWLPRRRSALI